MCGDSPSAKSRLSRVKGSSPRVWRQLELGPAAVRFRRFISTCVETASQKGEPYETDPVHLHVCGDSHFTEAAEPRAEGSSPRVWRQQLPILSITFASRFISTCVETAPTCRKTRGKAAVHLHVCGDSENAQFCESLLTGSSPRVWRQRFQNAGQEAGQRFISTCVETAICSTDSRGRSSVHLHVCGDSDLQY